MSHKQLSRHVGPLCWAVTDPGGTGWSSWVTSARSPAHGSSTSTLALINLLQGRVPSWVTQSLSVTLLCSQQLNQHWNYLTFNPNDLWPLDTHILGFAPSGLWPQSQRVACERWRRAHLAADQGPGRSGALQKGWSAACLRAGAGRVGPPGPDRLQH